VKIKKGQRVVMFYRSANFDEDVFEDRTRSTFCETQPARRIRGTGAHFCIGANLARMTIDLMFNAIADQMPTRADIPPERLRSGWLNGIKHWQVDYQGASKRPVAN